MELAIRKELQDSIIEKLSAVTYQASGETLFDEVVKYPVDLFAGFIASVQFGNRIVGERNMDYDLQETSFRIVYGDLVENNSDQDALDVKTDRLADVEDRLFNFFEAVPGAFEDDFDDFRVIDINGITSIPIIQETNRGIELIMDMSVTFVVDIQVKIIT